jgi:hypothetical protein
MGPRAGIIYPGGAVTGRAQHPAGGNTQRGQLPMTVAELRAALAGLPDNVEVFCVDNTSGEPGGEVTRAYMDNEFPDRRPSLVLGYDQFMLEGN